MSGFLFGAGCASALLIFLVGWSQAIALVMAAVRGFDLAALIAPLAVLGAAFVGTILLVRRWSCPTARTGTEASDPALDAFKEKVRRETSSGDGGF